MNKAEFELNRFLETHGENLRRYAWRKRKQKGRGHVVCLAFGAGRVQLNYITVSEWAALSTADEADQADEVLEQVMQSVDHDTHFVVQVAVPTRDEVWCTALSLTPSRSNELTPPA